MTIPRVSVSGNSCSIADEDLNNIRKTASKLVGQSVAHGFGEFPIDRASYAKGALGFFTRENICGILTADSGATPENHNELRRQYRAERMTEEKALEKGVVARQIPLRKACPASYDWSQSPVYNGVDDCEDVLDEIDGYGMPTVMYAVDGDFDRAQKYLDKLITAPLYTKYYDEGRPVACVSGSDGAGRRFQDSYHSIAVAATSAEFALRTFWGRGWTAWTLRPSCETAAGNTLAADDLMFDFGARIFVPIEVENNGASSRHTLVMTASAAAANGGLSSLIPECILQHVGYKRFIGGEYAKKVLLDAFGRGWKIAD